MQENEEKLPIKKRAAMMGRRKKDSSLFWRAKLVFTNPVDEEASTLVSQLLLQQESRENISAKNLYKFCWAYFPNSLARMLLDVYQCSVGKPEIASKSISLLHALLAHVRDGKIYMSHLVLPFIKPRLISCLLMSQARDSDIKILSRILSIVAMEVIETDNSGWDELSVCIVSVADDDLRKAFYLYRDLPLVYENFVLCILEGLFPEILTALNQEQCNAVDWSLALQTSFKMAIHLLDSVRSDLVGNILYAILKSANKLVRQGKEEILQQGLEELELFLREHTNRYKNDRGPHTFVLEFASMMERMKGTGKQTKTAARKIYQILRNSVLFEDIEDFG